MLGASSQSPGLLRAELQNFTLQDLSTMGADYRYGDSPHSCELLASIGRKRSGARPAISLGKVELHFLQWIFLRCAVLRCAVLRSTFQRRVSFVLQSDPRYGPFDHADELIPFAGFATFPQAPPRVFD